MRYALLLGWITLCLGCGDDSSADSEEDAVVWNCVCWSRPGDATGTGRVDEDLTWCSVEDPSDTLGERYEMIAAEIDRVGGCDPCEETEEPCHVDDNP